MIYLVAFLELAAEWPRVVGGAAAAFFLIAFILLAVGKR
jgi:hypothetical protein